MQDLAIGYASEKIAVTECPAPQILIVDDEASVRRVVARMLKSRGIAHHLAENTTVARRILSACPIDLVLCDVRMPGESGIDFVADIIGSFPQTAFVMLTGLDDPELAEETLEVGVYGYIIKPVRQNELLINISNALRRRDLEIQNKRYRRELESRISSKSDEILMLFDKMQKTMDGIIRAMAQAMESRDPYTAGHQRRVSQLAAAIASEMKFPGERIEGIKLAGIVHDLGKIAVPAEILSKPARLSDCEFGLIKSHPQVGYDILKDIDFPWPIPAMVLQHHERINGSGYPGGLSGDEIRIESKILCVADVLEAMSSHRPYRPALGMETALAEISKNKGVLYDPDVADACLKLVGEKGFVFTE